MTEETKCEKCGHNTRWFYWHNNKTLCQICYATEQSKDCLVNPTLQGWQCPVCGSVYSPFIQECDKCCNSNIRYITDNSTKGE